MVSPLSLPFELSTGQRLQQRQRVTRAALAKCHPPVIRPRDTSSVKEVTHMLQALLWAAVSLTLVVTIAMAACIMVRLSRSANKLTDLTHDAGVDPASRRPDRL